MLVEWGYHGIYQLYPWHFSIGKDLCAGIPLDHLSLELFARLLPASPHLKLLPSCDWSSGDPNFQQNDENFEAIISEISEFLFFVSSVSYLTRKFLFPSAASSEQQFFLGETQLGRSYCSVSKLGWRIFVADLTAIPWTELNICQYIYLR